MIKKYNGTYWDAVLDTRMCDKYNNAELTLIIKVAFEQYSPMFGYGPIKDSDGNEFECIPWKASAWEKWINHFVSINEYWWDGGFWLMNNYKLLPYSIGRDTFIPNIYCRFKYEVADQASAHHKITMVNLNSDISNDGSAYFRSNSGLMTNFGNNTRVTGTDSQNQPIHGITSIHETGHLLGLGHVDIGKPHCPDTYSFYEGIGPHFDTNEIACYGVTDWDKNSIMGAGTDLRREHGLPWREAIIHILKKGWVSHPMISWAVELERAYPRTIEEVDQRITINRFNFHEYR